MPSNYPAQNDVFTEPSSPETTPLSSAGTGTRNHPEHHRDLGDAIEAIQENAAVKTHNHSGEPDANGRVTEKLKQVHTHEEPDTDSAPSALHHTLGTGPNQAAPGNHKHDYNSASITGQPWVIVESTSRPSQPHYGMVIFETDTNRVRCWMKMPGMASPSWRLLPVGAVPIVRLLQGTSQKFPRTGALVEWRNEEEDTFDFFNMGSSLTEVVVKEPGLYDVAASVAWNNTDIFGDYTETIAVINGIETYRRQNEFIRGKNIFSPGRSQTVGVSGKIRFNANDRFAVKVKHNYDGFQWTYSSTSEKIDTRLDMIYLGP